MGVENNEAVLATTFSTDAMNQVREWVQTRREEHRCLFAFIPCIENGKETVILAPDGSKKCWETAREVACLRECFIDFLKSFNYEDGSNPFDFIEVGYGEFGQKVLRGNNQNMYSSKEYAE